jgi:hypothetical protein
MIDHVIQVASCGSKKKCSSAVVEKKLLMHYGTPQGADGQKPSAHANLAFSIGCADGHRPHRF